MESTYTSNTNSFLKLIYVEGKESSWVMYVCVYYGTWEYGEAFMWNRYPARNMAIQNISVLICAFEAKMRHMTRLTRQCFEG